jgi:hypothetical protein
MQQARYFTLEEAERALPRARRILARLRNLRLHARILAEGKEIPKQLGLPFTEEQSYQFAFLQEIRQNKGLNSHMGELFRTLDELDRTGCIINDLDEGCISFHHRHNGRDMLLCWREGDEHITRWQETKK